MSRSNKNKCLIAKSKVDSTAQALGQRDSQVDRLLCQRCGKQHKDAHCPELRKKYQCAICHAKGHYELECGKNLPPKTKAFLTLGPEQSDYKKAMKFYIPYLEHLSKVIPAKRVKQLFKTLAKYDYIIKEEAEKQNKKQKEKQKPKTSEKQNESNGMNPIDQTITELGKLPAPKEEVQGIQQQPTALLKSSSSSSSSSSSEDEDPPNSGGNSGGGGPPTDPNARKPVMNMPFNKFDLSDWILLKQQHFLPLEFASYFLVLILGYIIRAPAFGLMEYIKERYLSSAGPSHDPTKVMHRLKMFAFCMVVSFPPLFGLVTVANYLENRLRILLGIIFSVQMKIGLKKLQDVPVQDPHPKLRGKNIVDSECAIYRCESTLDCCGMEISSHPTFYGLYDRLTSPLKTMASLFLRSIAVFPGFGQEFLVSGELVQLGLSNRALNVFDGMETCYNRSSEMLKGHTEVSLPLDLMVKDNFNVVSDSLYVCHRIIDREAVKERQRDFRLPRVLTSTSTVIGLAKSNFPFLSHPKTGTLSSLSETSEGQFLFVGLCVGALGYTWSDKLFPTPTLAAQFLSSREILSEQLVKYPP